eukprot:GEMP01129493.1.p2 GENE.GEMP01129493.1~~GEMP01129493.1.p2  ORF type:complete len:137 (+),score=45.92 GEMP01129493.1:32-442(+)
MDAKAKARAKIRADAAYAKAINQAAAAAAAKTAAYVKAGFPAPPPLNICGICGAPPAAPIAAVPIAVAPAVGAPAAQPMAPPAAPSWREKSRINLAKAAAWPPGVGDEALEKRDVAPVATPAVFSLGRVIVEGFSG